MNLQITLLVLGIVIVAAIYFYSSWQQRSVRKNRNQTPTSATGAPLFGAATAVAPALDTDTNADIVAATDEQVATAAGIIEQPEQLAETPERANRQPQPEVVAWERHNAMRPEAESVEPQTAHDQAGQADETEATPIDDIIHPAAGFERLSQIDYYVKLSGERDVSRESVLAVYCEKTIGLTIKHGIFGLHLPDKVWRDLETEPEESRFCDLVVTVQLADKNGPISAHNMTRFSSVITALSETTGRGFAFMAPIENAHQQAIAIDRFRKRFDSIFVVNIKPEDAEFFEGPVIDRYATQIGLSINQNGFYARHKLVGKQKVCLYSLANMSDTGEFDIDNMRAVRTRGVTFFTRPATNRAPAAVFAEMVDAAKVFASRVKGVAIAPGYDALSSDAATAICRSIERAADEMESYGIAPGSEEATRLFQA